MQILPEYPELPSVLRPFLLYRKPWQSVWVDVYKRQLLHQQVNNNSRHQYNKQGRIQLTHVPAVHGLELGGNNRCLLYTSLRNPFPANLGLDSA